MPAMSITSSVGFDTVSKKHAFVPGVTAARHWSRSVPSTSTTSTPNFFRMSSTYRHDPKSCREDTTLSPGLTIAISAPLTAAIPEAVAKASSVPSRDAIRSSNMRLVGLP